MERERVRAGGRRVVVVEDDPDLSQYLCEVLRRAGEQPASFASGKDAVLAARSEPPDCVILDLGLPGIDGSSLVQVFRHDLGVPVIVVSGRRSHADVVDNLERGADDYMVKPVHGGELVARVHAVLRRHDAELLVATAARRQARTVTVPEVLHCGDLRIRVHDKQVERAGENVALTPRELDLLTYLARHPGVTISRDQILLEVWGATKATSAASTVNEHVRRLRRKLEDDPERPTRIVTDQGFGYRLVPVGSSS